MWETNSRTSPFSAAIVFVIGLILVILDPTIGAAYAYLHSLLKSIGLENIAKYTLCWIPGLLFCTGLILMIGASLVIFYFMVHSMLKE